MKQIRIYYESLEQGLHYIKPIVDKAAGNGVEVVMVRRPKKVNDGSVAAMLAITTPDALITGIDEGREYPLVFVEFTEAVTTEDHELQRINGAIVSYLAGAYYLKLSGEKKSEKEFGGAAYNPYSSPKIFLDERGYEGYIIAKWETVQGNNYTLQRNEKYPSCPPEIALFTATVHHAVSAFVGSVKEWYPRSLKELKKEACYHDYRCRVNVATGAKELLDTWENRRNKDLNRVRFFVKEDLVEAKINRFSHGTDPDRGILNFISFLFSEKRKVYGVYALVRPRGGSLLSVNKMDSLDNMQQRLDVALEKDKKAGGSIPDWLKEEFKQIASTAKNLDDTIDFSPVWERNRDKIKQNKTVLTLAYFLDGIKFNHNGITLTWDKRALVNTTDDDFIPAFAEYLGFKKYTSPTPLAKVLNDVDEDEVTYTLVHKVLRPNGFKIVSVSYPGAQGGGAVLPDPSMGKAQRREYPDVIAMPPAGSSIDVVLNESKGMFEKKVEEDVAKMLLYKTDRSRQEALKETLLVAQVIDANKQLRNIVVGVSFGAKGDRATSWNPCNVDFIFRITDRTHWSIGIFRQDLRDLIKKIEGDTDFPELYVCCR